MPGCLIYTNMHAWMPSRKVNENMNIKQKLVYRASASTAVLISSTQPRSIWLKSSLTVGRSHTPNGVELLLSSTSELDTMYGSAEEVAFWSSFPSHKYDWFWAPKLLLFHGRGSTLFMDFIESTADLVAWAKDIVFTEGLRLAHISHVVYIMIITMWEIQ